MSDPFNLRRARLSAGLTQRQLAEATHVPVPTIQRLEDGLGSHPANAKRIADYFHVEVVEVAPSLFESRSAA